jgi:hypothetical protein
MLAGAATGLAIAASVATQRPVPALALLGPTLLLPAGVARVSG